MIRVMVVDDSPLVRKIVTDILDKAPGISVVATAPSGELALRKLERETPDVVTMDMEMPGMGGLTAIREIMSRRPTPIIVLSAFAQHGAEVTVQALEQGAVDFIAKPEGTLSGGVTAIGPQLVEKVRQASTIRVHALKTESREGKDETERTGGTKKVDGKRETGAAHALGGHAYSAGRGESGESRYNLIAIGASTGGPIALKKLLTGLPAAMPAAIVVVQHMPPVFTAAFARRLDSICGLQVREAEQGDVIRAGQVGIAPGDYHMTVRRKPDGAEIHLNRNERVMGLRPSVDVLLHSVAEEYGSRGLGIILTGMGKDGASGMATLKSRGGCVLAQDRETSVIYGMNREVIENGHADEVVALQHMADRVVERFGALQNTNT
jgi:two-component system chemotaxis response regulator CheB